MSLRFIVAIGSVFILDQATKHIAQFFLPVTLNRGVSFGVLEGSYLSYVLLFGFLLFLFLTKHWRERSSFVYGLFVGAVISNLWDRFLYGGVRDFLPIPFTGIKNNLADWVIFLTLIWFAIQSKKPSVR